MASPATNRLDHPLMPLIGDVELLSSAPRLVSRGGLRDAEDGLGAAIRAPEADMGLARGGPSRGQVDDPDDYRPSSMWLLQVDPERSTPMAVIRERIAAGDRIPRHWHDVDEVVLDQGGRAASTSTVRSRGGRRGHAVHPRWRSARDPERGNRTCRAPEPFSPEAWCDWTWSSATPCRELKPSHRKPTFTTWPQESSRRSVQPT